VTFSLDNNRVLANFMGICIYYILLDWPRKAFYFGVGWGYNGISETVPHRPHPESWHSLREDVLLRRYQYKEGLQMLGRRKKGEPAIFLRAVHANRQAYRKNRSAVVALPGIGTSE